MQRQVRDYEEGLSEHAPRVELMVHGVGGTPPESMLDSTEIVRVRGDATAAFFRRKKRPEGSEYVREAYSWGGLTAGSASRAFWVFLAPFAFLNVAGWMLPGNRSQDGGGRRDHAIATALLRLIGLTVTVHAVIWIGQMTIDFAAWQCGGQSACRSSNWLLSVFGASIFDAGPGRRLVVGTLVPIGIVVVVRALTRRTIDRYETVDEEALEEYEVEGDDSFSDPSFWRRGRSIGSFASLHLGAAIAALGWVLAWTLAWLQPAGTPWLQLLLGWFGVVLLVAAGVGVTIGRDPVPTKDVAKTVVSESAVRWQFWLSVGVLASVLLVGVVWPGYEDPGRPAALDPYASTWFWIWVVSIIALVVFSIVVGMDPRRTRRIRAPFGADNGSKIDVGFGSFGAVVAASFGFLVAVAILGGFGAATTRLLGGRPAIQSTYLYDAFGLITTAWVIAIFVAFGIAWLTRKPQAIAAVGDDPSRFERDVTSGFQEDRSSFMAGRARKEAWLRTIRNSRDLRAFVPVVEAILGWMVAVAMAATVGLLAVQQFAPDSLRSWIVALPTPLVTATTWFVAVVIPVGIIWAVRRAYGSQQTRKLIGTLWDVVTFWPRWFHPLAPPSYCGRAVPELRTRIDFIVKGDPLDSSEAKVVVSAHSQGSVVALAALDGLRGHDWLARVSLLTHGSPLTRLYARLFPAHLSGPIDRVSTALGGKRWINLYRLTDPIGGAIGAEADEGQRGAWVPGSGIPLVQQPPDSAATCPNPIADPDLTIFSGRGKEPRTFPKKGDPYPPPLGHFEYERAPEFERSIDSLFGI